MPRGQIFENPPGRFHERTPVLRVKRLEGVPQRGVLVAALPVLMLRGYSKMMVLLL
jgi:hypothetical protein